MKPSEKYLAAIDKILHSQKQEIIVKGLKELRASFTKRKGLKP